MSKELINWKQLSIKLAGNDTSIRKNQIPKKYQTKVNMLLSIIDIWERWTKKTK